MSGSLNAAEAHDRIRRMFLDRVLTQENLQEAVNAMVKRGSEVEILNAQKVPHVADLARLDRELANLTAAIASGSRPEVVLAAIAERERARKTALAEVARLEKLERAARDFDAGHAEKKLRAELKTWRDLLERDPSRGRVVLRQLLQGPIEAEYSVKAGAWLFSGLASLDGVVHQIMDVPVSRATSEEIARLGLDPEQLGELYRNEIARLKALRLAGDRSAEESSTSALQSPSCPRGDSNTRHAV